jgi:hypothetical protein
VKITYVCSECGSDNVSCDATAEWDVETQAWVLRGTFQNTDCDDCGGETSLIEKPAPRLIETTGRANYWILPNGTYHAKPADDATPPSATAGGYASLQAIKRLKGDA